MLFTVGRSFFDASGTRFVGGDNYAEMFRDPATLKAIRNTTIWVVVAPTLLTGLGLVLAVLVEKIRWATAFKLLLFMPMAVSFLAAGIIFRLAYDEDPDKGVLNAAVVGVHDAFAGTSSYPTARARDGQGLTRAGDGSYGTADGVSPGRTVSLGLVGVRPDDLPKDARPAYTAAGRTSAPDELRGVVYLDFTPGGEAGRARPTRRRAGCRGCGSRRCATGRRPRAPRPPPTAPSASGTWAPARTRSGCPRRTSRRPTKASPGSARRSSRRPSSGRTCGSGPASPWS
uniref:ABC transmembrane type-1 domain-containing protein n=1 Tax=Streptomyces avermitilis TaxID=33903 RepID=A0A499W1M9_STRAX|nr:hypothetical protein SAVMC3_71680 [Streptomyces avermitilis]